MSPHRRIVWLLSIGALLAWGCGFATHGLPADTSGAGGEGTGGTASHGATTTTTSSSAATTSATSSSAATTSATSSSAASTTSSTSTTTSSTTASTTSTTTSSTTSTTSTGGGPCQPDQNNICCNTQTCMLPAEKCCYDTSLVFNSSACVMTAQGCSGNTFEMRCDAAEDCMTGKVCCGAWDGGKYTSMTCVDMAMCQPPQTLGQAGNYPSCNYPGGMCPPGLTCSLATSLGGTHGYCFPP